MRRDRALAKELGAILDGLHDPTVSDDPFVWLATEAEQQRRHDDLRTVRERLASFVYVSRAGTIAKLLGFGTLLPLILFGLLFAADLPRNPALRAGTWGLLAVTVGVFVVIAISVWWRPRIDRDISYAAYAIPRGWSFSFRNGDAAWQQLRRRFSYFERGDEDQSINGRIWGFFDDETRRPAMMFIFHWVDVEIVTRFNPQTKKVETKKVRRPHDRHGMFVGMPESRTRMRITEVGGSGGLPESIRLEYGELNDAVDIYCHAADELAVRQFLSPAVQEVALELSRELQGMHLDFYPGFVLVASKEDFLDGAPHVRLDRDAPRFEERIQPWIDGVESFRVAIDNGLRRIAKYND